MDCGGENEEVKDIMNLHHGPGRGSAIQGRSVHNVRVERSWCDAKKDALQPIRDLLVFLCAAPEESGEGLVDMTDQNHIWAIHYVFCPRSIMPCSCIREQGMTWGSELRGTGRPFNCL
jgi:hypothetical protein